MWLLCKFRYKHMKASLKAMLKVIKYSSKNNESKKQVASGFNFLPDCCILKSFEAYLSRNVKIASPYS